MLHLRKWPIVSAQVTTVQEDIDPSQKPFRGLIDVDLLGEAAELGATHVLVGIDWGAVGTITCEDENHDREEAIKVKGALQAEVNKLKGLQCEWISKCRLHRPEQINRTEVHLLQQV